MDNELKYLNHLDLRKKMEEIRLKPIDDMTLDDAHWAINLFLSYATFFPCGYSHTVKAIEILEKGDSNGK